MYLCWLRMTIFYLANFLSKSSRMHSMHLGPKIFGVDPTFCQHSSVIFLIKSVLCVDSVWKGRECEIVLNHLAVLFENACISFWKFPKIIRVWVFQLTIPGVQKLRARRTFGVDFTRNEPWKILREKLPLWISDDGWKSIMLVWISAIVFSLKNGTLIKTISRVNLSAYFQKIFGVEKELI